MQTYDTRVTIVLKRIIEENIRSLEINIARGYIQTLDEYKLQAGKVQGLEVALEAIDEAIRKIETE